MGRKFSRRDFVVASAAAGVLTRTGTAFGRAPAVVAAKAATPIVVSSANGNRFKNGGERTCVEEAFERMPSI